MRKETMQEICNILLTTDLEEGESLQLFSEGHRGCALGALCHAKGITDQETHNCEALKWRNSSWILPLGLISTDHAFIASLYPGATTLELHKISAWFDGSEDSYRLGFADIAALIQETMLEEKDIPVAPTEVPELVAV